VIAVAIVPMMKPRIRVLRSPRGQPLVTGA